jgi:arylsulfatase A-like enzyme
MQACRIGAVDPVAHTPFLDGLASEGSHLTHLISAHGQCVPSRASFMTGLYPHECGVMVNYGFHGHQNRLSSRQRTLGHVFRDAGYRTAYFGKCHFGIPLEGMGFEHACDYDARKVDDEEAATRGISQVPEPLRRDHVAAADAVDFLKSYEPGEQPLFFVFSTNLPHPPFYCEPRYAELFPPEEMVLPETFYSETFAGKPAFQREHAEDGRHGAVDEELAREELSQYYSMIATMDEHCGQVAAQFRRLGMWDDTVVLFLSDHGDMMGGHRMRLKGTLPYDELYRVPGIVKLPGGAQSRRPVVDDLLSSVQLAGTLVKAAGLPEEEVFAHGDFYGSLHDEVQTPAQEGVFFEHYAAYWGTHPFYGIRTSDYKYIRYYGVDATEEMYHLATDPHELRNVVGEDAYARKRKELADQADNWWQSTGGRTADYYESEHFRSNTHNAP